MGKLQDLFKKLLELTTTRATKVTLGVFQFIASILSLIAQNFRLALIFILLTVFYIFILLFINLKQRKAKWIFAISFFLIILIAYNIFMFAYYLPTYQKKEFLYKPIAYGIVCCTKKGRARFENSTSYALAKSSSLEGNYESIAESPNNFDPCVSTDGKILIYVQRSNASQVIMCKPPYIQSKAVPLTSIEQEEWSPSWNPNSELIAYVSRTNDNVYHLNVYDYNSKINTVIYSSNNKIDYPTWSPNGKYLIYISYGNDFSEIHVYDYIDKIWLTGYRSWEGYYYYHPSFSPSGASLAIGYGKTESNSIIQIWDITFSSDRLLFSNYKELNCQSKNVNFPAWSSRSNKIAYIAFEENICKLYIMDLDKDTYFQVMNTYADTPCWSYSGNRLLYSALVEHNLEIYERDVEKGVDTRMTDDSIHITEAKCSSDGAKVISVMQKYISKEERWKKSLLLVDLHDGNKRILFENLENDISCPTWSPDGRKLAFLSEDKDGMKHLCISEEPFTEYYCKYHNKNIRYIDWGNDVEIFMCHNNAGNYWIHKLYVAGETIELKRILRLNGVCKSFDVSPNGDMIAIDCDCSGKVNEKGERLFKVYIVNLSSGSARCIEGQNDQNDYIYPRWSPNQQALLYCVQEPNEEKHNKLHIIKIYQDEPLIESLFTVNNAYQGDWLIEEND